MCRLTLLQVDVSMWNHIIRITLLSHSKAVFVSKVNEYLFVTDKHSIICSSEMHQFETFMKIFRIVFELRISQHVSRDDTLKPLLELDWISPVCVLMNNDCSCSNQVDFSSSFQCTRFRVPFYFNGLNDDVKHAQNCHETNISCEAIILNSFVLSVCGKKKTRWKMLVRTRDVRWKREHANKATKRNSKMQNLIDVDGCRLWF